MNPLSDYATETVALDRLKIAARYDVGAYVRESMELSTYQDEIFDRLVYQLRSEVLAQTLSTRSCTANAFFDHPATTWQMFKHRHEGGRWLGWLARRWPVVMETTTKPVTFATKERVAFPDATIRFPKTLGTPMYFQTVEAIR